MKISRATITLIDVPLLEPFVVSYATYDSMPSIILTLETDDGTIGYGESVPDGHITGERLPGESSRHSRPNSSRRSWDWTRGISRQSTSSSTVHSRAAGPRKRPWTSPAGT
ncbi:L-alanine-DL-glutamate epimerase-like enolase superfamily enzyme [Arthrobacter sp. V1I7]|nr:L-alanine-DL-glutamate epimerase-like enolase superfamily enzyme [Arthrobacter sp. V1I7]